MKTLVLVEHEGGAIKDATLATVTAAAQLGDVHLLVAGSGVGALLGVAALAIPGSDRLPPPAPSPLLPFPAQR